jgi:Tripartite ATP-independent periplasmic transporter, DctM component
MPPVTLSRRRAGCFTGVGRRSGQAGVAATPSAPLSLRAHSSTSGRHSRSEVAAALIILGPVLIPIMQSLGVDLVHFGVVMVVNLAIGTIHPPVGNCLYIVSAISGESIGKCSIAVIPVVGVMVAALLLITFVPELVLFVPRYFGY